jgi:hypothetical protein
VPNVNGFVADHHKYVVPNMIDGDVVAEQSRKQADKLGESSYVHHHKAGDPCEGHEHNIYGDVQYKPLVPELNKPIA